MSPETSIANLRKEFEQILQFVSEPTDRQIHNVEKTIFQNLLKMGRLLLSIFLAKHTTKTTISHVDKNGVELKLHSRKKRDYFSIFGKIVISRPYYWKKGVEGSCPLDAKLNLPDCEYSYLLQEWGSGLATEQPYKKAAGFLERFLGIQLWDSALEEILVGSSVDAQDFYKNLPVSSQNLPNELLVASVDCKGVLMRKSELEKKETLPKYRRLNKLGERIKKPIKKSSEKLRDGKKKMSCVTAVYTIKCNVRTAENILANHKKGGSQKRPVQPRPESKIVYGTLSGKQVAFEQLKSEVSRRNGSYAHRIALVDGEAKLIEFLKAYLPDFEIIRDIVHVNEYLWDAAHIVHNEGTKEAENWVSKRFEMLLNGQVQNIISDLSILQKQFKRSKTKVKELKRVSTYLENGQEYMKYDRYLSAGYPIGTGVIEGTCKNLVNDRCEHSGMHWTAKGANAMLLQRSIHLNCLEKEYWQFHIEKERYRLYGEKSLQVEDEKLAA